MTAKSNIGRISHDQNPPRPGPIIGPLKPEDMAATVPQIRPMVLLRARATQCPTQRSCVREPVSTML
jgi:hypothetical protein